jgi:hypothetical protein
VYGENVPSRDRGGTLKILALLANNNAADWVPFEVEKDNSPFRKQETPSLPRGVVCDKKSSFPESESSYLLYNELTLTN